MAETPFAVDLLETDPQPLYQRIADGSMHLKKLGLNNEAIARHLDVDGKTVAKALRWLNDNSSRR
jgi:hypothetical protein